MSLKFFLKIFSALLLLSFGSSATASEAPDSLSGRYLFLHLPGNTLELIPHSTRVDMLDYFDAGQKYSPLNALRGKCSLLALTPDYADVQLSEVSNVQMLLLPAGKQRVVAVVYTVDAGDSPDSQLLFYDSALKPVPLKKYFKEPVLKDFLLDTPEASRLQSLVPFLLVSYRLNPDLNPPTLTATINLKGSMTEEDVKRIRPVIARDSIVYEWTGKKFSLLSNR